MKFAKISSAQPEYLRGSIVSVEVDISRGMHSFSIVGMPNRAVEEARDRVSSALKNTGFQSPKVKNEKLVVSLVPAELKKEGAYHDLAITLGYLLATEEIDFNSEGKIFIGELSLDGTLQSVTGVLPIVRAAYDAGYTEIFLPFENRKEAALVSGIRVYPVKHLREVIHHLNKHQKTPTFIPLQKPTLIDTSRPQLITDFKDVRGQSLAKRGLEIAAAGGHNVCMYGPPGTGKTMLARAFTSILPSLLPEEMLEVTGIHSVAGNLNTTLTLVHHPPFRAPHHTSSYVAIIGGGTTPKPGEVTLAHRGVLFLDEFPEFDKKVLESLRQPLEDGEVTVSRARGTITFPAEITMITAMNPCPCGFAGSPHTLCKCSASDIARYQRKLSGPIIDRIDIWLPVEHVEYEQLANISESHEESSDDIRLRVEHARERQYIRNSHHEMRLNKNLSSKEIQKEPLSNDVLQLLNDGARKLNLSPRAYHRIIKLARTIADLDGIESIQNEHILEALQYRPHV